VRTKEEVMLDEFGEAVNLGGSMSGAVSFPSLLYSRNR